MIKAETMQRDMRRIFGNMLRKYFDGQAHSFGGAPITFPLCDVVFDRPQQSGPLERPMIYAEQFSGRPHQRKATGSGFSQFEDIPYRFLVLSSDPGRVWDVNDKVNDLLGVVINGAANEIAGEGVKLLRVLPRFALVLDPSQEVQVSQRVATYRLAIVYGVSGSGSGAALVNGGIA